MKNFECKNCESVDIEALTEINYKGFEFIYLQCQQCKTIMPVDMELIKVSIQNYINNLKDKCYLSKLNKLSKMDKEMMTGKIEYKLYQLLTNLIETDYKHKTGRYNE